MDTWSIRDSSGSGSMMRSPAFKRAMMSGRDRTTLFHHIYRSLEQSAHQRGTREAGFEGVAADVDDDAEDTVGATLGVVLEPTLVDETEPLSLL